MSKIFVQIASFRDPQLVPTIKDMLANAKKPENLVLGIARQYAERYNSRYPTGLIPESAPMVEDIADFWCQYHLGKPLQEWLGTS